MAHTVVQLTTHFEDGDSMHRLTWPAQALADLPDFRVVDVHYMSPYCYRLALDADLLILSMIMDAELAPIIRWRKTKAKPTVFEVNNWPFDMHPLTPMYDLWTNPARQADWLYAMSLVDLVQTSTPLLAEAFKPYCARVVVFPNQMAKVADAPPEKPDSPLVVGWAGSLSHAGDLAHIAKPLSKWILEHDNVVLAVMGHEGMEKLFALPPEKKRYTPWGGMDKYEEFLKGVHIGLAPLLDTPFNRSRSDVKWLEYAAQGCVFVGQKLPAYAQVEDGKTGFLFKDGDGLVKVLDKLHKDRKLLAAVGRQGFEYVKNNRLYSIAVKERAEVYKGLMGRKPPEGAEKWDLDARSKFPVHPLPVPLPPYVAIKLDADDAKALAALNSRRPEIPEPVIEQIERRYGDFHLTSYARAMHAMARRDASGAEQHLRRSISLYPGALASMQMLATLMLGMRRVQEARDMLAHAVQWHPACMPIHRQMLGVAEAQSDWPAAIKAAEDWEANCRQDPIAHMRKGLVLIRSGKLPEGVDALCEGIERFKDRPEYKASAHAAELAVILRLAEPFMAREDRWHDVILKAVELFPQGLWLPTRAGTICFERGEYARGLRLLEQARERLDSLEWQRIEGINFPPEFRRLVEFYRMACSELAK